MLSVVQAEVEQLDAIEPGPQAIELREATLKKVKESLSSACRTPSGQNNFKLSLFADFILRSTICLSVRSCHILQRFVTSFLTKI